MKKIICVILSIIMLSAVAVTGYADNDSTAPVIIETVYPTEDVVIADIIATQEPYNADNSGSADSTAAIQKAIDDCAANGGGTVWLPAGRYRVTGNIYIRQFVTLRGDYQDPDEGTQYGTLIVADVESSDTMSPGLFTVGASAGAVGLTVWYPDQTLENVKPYPYTFYVTGNADYMLQTIKNCTLINSYRGIGACSECENDIYECHEMLTIENVKGTCLYEGLNSHNSADVDTVETLYILNKYWVQAGEEFNAPEEEALDAYTKANAYGLVLGDLEWPEFADVKVSDMLYGMLFREGIRYCFSGSFTDLYITDCEYGICVPKDIIQVRGKSWGIAVLNGVVEGDTYAISDPDKSAFLLTNVVTEGKVTGRNIRRYKADMSAYTPDYDRTYSKPCNMLYVVSADKTGKTDASAAVQSVLNEAAATGGVVYLPAGLYRFDGPVSVPAGVELRGSSSVATRCQNGNSNGTLIISYYGYDTSLQPLVTLAGDNAGLNGLRFDYLLNSPVDGSGKYRSTSPAVYSECDNVYVTNCAITLAGVGIELNGCNNAYIKKVVGCSFESMFRLTDCTDCQIEGCLQNGNTLPRNGYAAFTDIPEMQNRFPETEVFNFVFIPITRIHTNFIELDSCSDIAVFNTFIYGGKTFLKSVDSDAVFVNVGHDGSSKTESAFIMNGGSITLLNSMRSTSDGQMCNLFYSIENDTQFRSYNSQAVGMGYKEHVVLENLTLDELDKSEKLYYHLQPLYRFITFFGNLFMKI